MLDKLIAAVQSAQTENSGIPAGDYCLLWVYGGGQGFHAPAIFTKAETDAWSEGKDSLYGSGQILFEGGAEEALQAIIDSVAE